MRRLPFKRSKKQKIEEKKSVVKIACWIMNPYNTNPESGRSAGIKIKKGEIIK